MEKTGLKAVLILLIMLVLASAVSAAYVPDYRLVPVNPGPNPLPDSPFAMPHNPACSRTTGDVNNDGLVNNFDLRAMRLMINGKQETNPCADLNNDGKVNNKDQAQMRLFLRYIRRNHVVFEPNLPDTCTAKGDLNGDMRIDYLDLTIMREMIVKVIHKTDCADMNNDGKVNQKDIKILRSMIPSVVDDENHAPVFDEIQAQSVNEGETLAFTVNASDEDDDVLFYSAANLPEGAVFNDTTQEFSWTPGYNQSGEYTITFTVTDDEVNVSVDVAIAVNNVPQPAEMVVTLTAEPLSGVEPLEVSFTCTVENGTGPYSYIIGVQADGWGGGGGQSSPVDDNSISFNMTFNEGDYNVTCRVRDSQNASNTDMVSIHVDNETQPENHAPVFEQIEDITIDEEYLIEFNVNATDPDGDNVTITASNLPAGLDFDGETFSWYTHYGDAGNYTITFTATDGMLNSTMDVHITVNDIPEEEQMAVSLVSDVYSGTALLDANLTCSVQNGEAPFYYRWIFIHTWEDSNGTQSLVTEYRHYDMNETSENMNMSLDAGNWTVGCTVGDSQVRYISANAIMITVADQTPQPENHAPVFDQIGPFTVNESEELTFTVTATDEDGDNFTISAANLPEGAVFDGSAFSWTPLDNQSGNYTITFTVSDGELNDTMDVAIEVLDLQIPQPENNAPVFDSIGNFVINETETLDFTVSATDADNDDVTITASNLPEGAVFDGSAFSWTPLDNQSGNYTVTFTATDGMNETSMDVAIEVLDLQIPQPENHAPVFEEVSDIIVNESYAVMFSVNATDPDGDNVSITAENLPQGAVFASDMFIWIPAYGQTGTYTITFTATDGELNATMDVAIEVLDLQVPQPQNNAPVFENIGGLSVYENQTLSFSVNATDADNDTLAYSAANLPDGASFAGTIFSWTPLDNQSGNYTVTFTVTDGQLSDIMDVAIEVIDVQEQNETTNDTINHAPVMDNLADIVVNETEPVLIFVNASDADNDTLSYSALGIPSGAVFNATSQLFSWTPLDNQSGLYPVIFTVTDGNLSDAQAILITVLDINSTGSVNETNSTVNNSAPVMDAIADVFVNENQTVSIFVNATDADNDTLTYGASNLPAGALFNTSTQTFSWRPLFNQSGQYAVVFTVTDGIDTDAQAVLITVNETGSYTDDEDDDDQGEDNDNQGNDSGSDDDNDDNGHHSAGSGIWWIDGNIPEDEEDSGSEMVSGEEDSGEENSSGILTEEDEDAAEAQDIQPEEDAGEEEKSSLSLIWVLLIIILFGGIGFAVYRYLNQKAYGPVEEITSGQTV